VGRSGVTALLVAGLVLLGVAALVDTVWKRAGDEPTGPRRQAMDEVAAPLAAHDEVDPLRRRLEHAGVTGTLLYSDRECVIHALELPTLERVRGPHDRSCRFNVSPDGWLGFGDEVTAPGGFDTARCEGGRTIKWTIGTGAERGPFLRLRGCEPAFHPEGGLTFVRDGMLLAGGPCSRQPPSTKARSPVACSRVLLSRADVARALARFPWIAGDHAAVRAAAWLDASRAAVVVRLMEAEGAGDFVAVFRGRRLLGEPYLAGAVDDLRPSPLGRYVAARTPSGVIVLDRSGTWRLVTGPASAVAWSADERWIAIARAGAVTLADNLDLETARVVQVPVQAADLYWR
jgi:hypothetical protein